MTRAIIHAYPFQYPSIRSIQAMVAHHYDVTVLDIVSIRRNREIIRPRYVAIWLCRHATPHTITEIARHFGDRDRSSIDHSIKRIDREIAADPEFAAEARSLLNSVNGADYGERRRPMLRVVA